MSEIKRAVLSTLEPQKVSDKLPKKHCKTVRISVVLAESNEDKCPEFNYKDELAAVKKKSKQSKSENSTANGLGLFENEDDDDVRRIAAQMEAKYGTSNTGNKKKRKGRRDDYADIGMGYDESDSFIDNTDGYDEIIPQNVTTLHGGFYINSGALEFKTDDEATTDLSSDSSDSQDERKPKRKRVLDSSSEEDDDNEKESTSQKDKKPKLGTPKITMQQAIKKKLFSAEKIQVKKKRLVDPVERTVKDLLKEKREDLNMSIPTELKHDPENPEKDSLKENKRPMSISSITDAIESVINQTNHVPSTDGNKPNSFENKKNLIPDKQEMAYVLDGESSQDGNKSEKAEIVLLPQNLPSDILDVINSIKKAALDYKDGGKVKFFTDEVNLVLLNLERKCKCLGKSSRTRIYEHLAPFVKCRKETLIRRAKNLVIEDEERKLAKLIRSLKLEVDQIMPTVITEHEKETQKVLQKKFSQEAMENEELKSLKIPRKRFQCPEITKKLLRDIVSTKRRCLLLEGKQKESIEDQLTEYLSTKIQILWPEGWMSVANLKKLCAPAMVKTPEYKSDKVKQIHSQNNSLKLNQGHSSLTITPIMNIPMKTTSVANDITVSKIVGKNSIGFKPAEIERTPTSTPKIEKLQNEGNSQKKYTDSGVIVVNTSKSKEEHIPVIPKSTHCPIIDLTEASHPKQTTDSKPFKILKDSTENVTSSLPPEISNLRNSELSITPTFLNNGGDDISKVIENLKALQKLSSPIKTESNTSSSPVSVIAYNKGYSPSSNSSASAMTEYGKGEFGFQEDFQKQFISSLNQINANSLTSTPNNKCS